MPSSAEGVYAWHARPGAFERLLPPSERVEVVSREGTFGDGHRVTVRAPLLGPVKIRLSAEVFGVIPGLEFRDRSVAVPFAEWVHTHRMIPDGPDRSVLEDSIEYRLPLGAVGRWTGGKLLRRQFARMFAYRHAVTASDLRRHRSHPPRSIAVTGSRGLIGSALIPFLTTGGHQVVRFLRSQVPSGWQDGTTAVSWDPDGPVDPKSFDGIDAVIHLAGENIAGKRWSDARKKLILESRTGPTRRLAEAIAAAARPPRVLVSASAIGIYGDRGDEQLDEASAAGTGFLADVCREWEAATEPARRAGVRVVNLRIGIVLTPRGATLGALLPAFRAGAGAMLGSGKQWMSWIAIGDLIGAIHHAIVTDSLAGPVNATAPVPVTNREFGRILARVLGRPYLLTLPAFALRTLFGEIADAAMLASQRVNPRRLLESGFAFDHPDLEPALRFLLGR